MCISCYVYDDVDLMLCGHFPTSPTHMWRHIQHIWPAPLPPYASFQLEQYSQPKPWLSSCNSKLQPIGSMAFELQLEQLTNGTNDIRVATRTPANDVSINSKIT